MGTAILELIDVFSYFIPDIDECSELENNCIICINSLGSYDCTCEFGLQEGELCSK